MFNFAGKTPYLESLYVNCDCMSHAIELYIYAGKDEYLYGIDWHGSYKKIKYPDVTFGGFLEFERFVNACHKVSDFTSNYEIFSTTINTKNELYVNNGFITVSRDEEDYLWFTRLNNNMKVCWNLCLATETIEEFLTKLDRLCVKAIGLECGK